MEPGSGREEEGGEEGGHHRLDLGKCVTPPP